MADLGAILADDEIANVEKELRSIYDDAYRDILRKQEEFNRKYKAKEAIHLKDVQNGKWTQEEFDSWRAGQIFQGKQWKNKKNQILDTIYNTNSAAMDIVNGKTKGVFTFNANYTAYQLEHGAGINFGFGLYDESSVINLIKNDPQLLPEWKIDQPKDYIWNQKKLNRQVTLGIVEGESLDKIANRLSESLVSQNFNKMRTFARTAMTGAQNAGRQISLDEAKKLGIDVKKEWMATLDAHTRMTHRKLDGQKVDTDKSFDINGMSIRFPGDPLAPAALVYNCRCTLVGDLVKYPSEYERYDNLNGKRIKNMTYGEWEAENKKAAELAEETVMMLDASEATGLVSVFSDKKMSNLYNEMREIDSKTANAFYKELKSMGKPSEVWQQYLDGTLPSDIDTSRLNGILQSYADKKGINVPGSKITPPTPPVPKPTTGSNLKDIFGGKKMSHVYNDMKGIDSKMANAFYKELGGMGKPSDVWQQYLDGKLSPEQRTKIDGFLNDYANKAGLIKPVAPAGIDVKGLVGDRKMSNFYNELKTVDSKIANQFYNELKTFGKPSEVWQKYVNGEIKSDKLDNILKQHFGEKVTPKTPSVKPKTPATKPKATAKPKATTKPKTTAKPKVTPKPQKTEQVPDRAWAEKSLKPRIFTGTAKNSADTRRMVIDTVMKTDENYRKCFISTMKQVRFYDDGGKAYYRDSGKTISINFDKILARDKSLGTLFHENGHAMDAAYGRLKTGKYFLDYHDRASMSPKFLAAIDKDMAYLDKNIDKLGYHRDIWNDSSKGVQDFFSSLKPLNDKGPRKGKIPTGLRNQRHNWGHSYDYYTRKDDPMIDASSELFANISGGYGDEKQMAYMRKYFPNSVKEFENIIDEMATMVKI